MGVGEPVRQLEDMEAIRQLANRYSHYVSIRNWDGMREIFHRECVWDIKAFGRHVGVEAVVAFFQTVIDRMPHITQVNYSQLIDVDGDAATMHCYHSERLVMNGKDTLTLGRYEDRLVKESGRWWFLERIFHGIHLQPMEGGEYRAGITG